MGSVWFFGGILTGVGLLLLTFGTELFAPFNRFMNISGPPFHAIKEIGLIESVMQFFSLFCEAFFGINTPYAFLRISLCVLFLAVILLSADLKGILYTGILLISWIIGFCLLLIMAKALAGLRHAAIMPFFLAMTWMITPKIKVPKITPILAYILIGSILCGGKTNLDFIMQEVNTISFAQQKAADFLLANGYDREDVLIIGDNVVFNSVIMANLRHVPSIRYCAGGEPLDMTYTVWQYPNKQVFTPNYRDVIDFALTQAEQNKDKYRAVLFLYRTTPGESIGAGRLLYNEPSPERAGKFYFDEYVDIYLLAEDGQLINEG
jgi:hypothetical protein